LELPPPEPVLFEPDDPEDELEELEEDDDSELPEELVPEEPVPDEEPLASPVPEPPFLA
jgi:hypothetical protein